MKGPLFANIVLADEINRTPPKTQSALLEAMQERSVTVAGQHYPSRRRSSYSPRRTPLNKKAPTLFRSPTRPLHVQHLGRLPDLCRGAERSEGDHRRRRGQRQRRHPGDEIAYFQQLIRRMPIADNVLEYAVGLVGKTRPGRERATDDVNAYLSWGAGPRASQYLVVGAKVNAALNGKYSPDIEDVKPLPHPSSAPHCPQLQGRSRGAHRGKHHQRFALTFTSTW